MKTTAPVPQQRVPDGDGREHPQRNGDAVQRSVDVDYSRLRLAGPALGRLCRMDGQFDASLVCVTHTVRPEQCKIKAEVRRPQNGRRRAR